MSRSTHSVGKLDQTKEHIEHLLDPSFQYRLMVFRSRLICRRDSYEYLLTMSLQWQGFSAVYRSFSSLLDHIQGCAGRGAVSFKAGFCEQNQEGLGGRYTACHSAFANRHCLT